MVNTPSNMRGCLLMVANSAGNVYNQTGLRPNVRLIAPCTPGQPCGGGHKNYIAYETDVAGGALSTLAEAAGEALTLICSTPGAGDSLYWSIVTITPSGCAGILGAGNVGTLGQDVDMGGGPICNTGLIPSEWQYVDAGHSNNTTTVGGLTTDQLCNPATPATGTAKGFTTSGGELRDSVYVMVSDPTESNGYNIIGSATYQGQTTGFFYAVIIIDPTPGGFSTDGEICTSGCPPCSTPMTFSPVLVTGWGVRAPPSNYGLTVVDNTGVPLSPQPPMNYNNYPTINLVTYAPSDGPAGILQVIDATGTAVNGNCGATEPTTLTIKVT